MQFKTGDRVEIVNYGQAIWDENGMIDIQPQLVGKKGTVFEATESQPGYERYSLDIDNYGYIAWFGTAQLMRI